MVNDSKILTVSYGTFSCTLEGFDDPFNTMRSIAEYFRDLAADDRYFGAEPPTPDPQMLHSIAEKEIQRRVEARVQDNGLILRQMDGDTAAPEATPETETTAEAAPADTSETAPITAPVQTPTPAPAPLAQPAVAQEDTAAATPETSPEMPEDDAPAEEALVQNDASVVEPVAAQPAPDAHIEPAQAEAPAATGSIADKLERIRAAVAQRGQAEYVEDQHAAVAAPIVAASDEDMLTEDTAEHEADAEDIDLGALMSAAADEEEAFEEDAPEVEAAPEDATDAEVTDEAVEAADDAASDVDDAVTTDAEDAADADVALHDMDPNLAADIAEATRVDAAEEVSEDPIRRVRARVVKMRRADFEAEQDAAQTDAEADVDADLDAGDEVASEDTADVPTLAEEEAAEALATDAADIADDEMDAEDLAEKLRLELGDSSLDDDAEDELMRELAQVTAGDAAEDALALDTDDTEDEPAEITPLSELNADEMEEQLEAEAEAEADDTENLLANMLGGADADAQDDTETTSQDAEERAARNIFDDSDADVSRLLDETDREMEKGDTKRRRNAIQHLKAAVGAVRAEKESGAEAKSDSDDKDVYREDLARVVRPRRPESNAQTKRQMPPLMLVSEQRVDAPTELPNGANIAPVRPRRVSSAALAVREEQEIAQEMSEDTQPTLEGAVSFAEFADARGAEDLVDVLEAAAAYANHVEGRETVTRPQIMQLASEALPEEAPVEERLRSFGQLLRQGKIKKLKRGHFAVAETSRFKPK